MVEEVSRAHLAPGSLAAACTLGTVSAALGAGLELETEGGQTVRGNLFIGAVAPSGVGKGVASNAITAPFRNFENNLVAGWKTNVRPALAARAEVLGMNIKALKKRIAANKAMTNGDDDIAEMTRLKAALENVQLELVEPCLVTADATKEALALLLSRGKHEAVASICSEARGCLDVLCGRYNDMTDESIYTSSWSGDPYTIHRKCSPPVHLTRPCLTLLWLFQPDKLAMLLRNGAMTSSGLLARFLMLNTHAQPQLETGDRGVIDQAVEQAWGKLITDLATYFHQADRPFKICPTPVIKTLFREYKNSIIVRRRSGGDLADVNEYAARWCENAWRLTLVLHAAEHGQNASEQAVSDTTANKAITLMNWFAAQQLQILSAGREEKKSERMFALTDILEKQTNRSCTLRDLQRRHGFEAAEVMSLAKEHPNKLVVESVHPNGPGRTSKVVRLLL